MCITIVVSIHGRQDQDVNTAINILAKAAAMSDLHVQSLFFRSPETRSVYVWGLVKMDRVPILSKQKEQHDFTLLFDPELDEKEAAAHAKDGSVVIFNATEKINTAPFRKRKIKCFSLDAAGIGLAVSSRPKPGLAMLGALVKNFSKLSMKSIKSAADHLTKENLIAVDEGHKAVKMVK